MKHYTSHTGIPPIIKWAGGKEKELQLIFSNAPKTFTNYYEPFVGGGAVFTAFAAKRHFINDKSEELISLYRCIAARDTHFFDWLKAISKAWKSMLAFVESNRQLCCIYMKFREGKLSHSGNMAALTSFFNLHTPELNSLLPKEFAWHRDVYIKELKLNILRKIARMRQIEARLGILPIKDVFKNIETAFMSALYMYFRHVYNDKRLMHSSRSLATAVFVFIRNYAYSGMFRYSSKGIFNVPYGGMGYNHKLLDKKIKFYQSPTLLEHFSTTQIYNHDFEYFLEENPPGKNDFVFLDPPYDSDFSTYAQNTFTHNDHRRLANYLIRKCTAQWMLIIKNTQLILSLYANQGLTIQSFNKKYLVSIMNRNNKNAQHLIITNF